MNELLTIITLFAFLPGCSSVDSDHLSLYDTRHASSNFIIEQYEMYPGLDVPSRFVQNGDTTVIYQLSTNGSIEYKMWEYEAGCDLREGELVIDTLEVAGKSFRVSRIGEGAGSCEQTVVYSYID